MAEEPIPGRSNSNYQIVLGKQPVAFACATTAAIALGLLALLAGMFILVLSFDNSHELSSQIIIDSQIASIKAKQAKSVTFYGTAGTDKLLLRLLDVPEIEEIRFELCDVTDEGMKELLALQNLKTLVVYGGNPSIGDKGVAYIAQIKSLEKLELINTQATDRCLPYLKNMHNLRTLVLYRDREQRFTKAGLEDIKNLKQLKKLNLDVLWATDAVIKDLQQALPNCEINQINNDLQDDIP